jgi:ubiquinone/menaquinone biosynthesis C-methylase UbiE
MDDIQRFDRWSSTYEHSWLQLWLFDRVHKRVLAVAAQGPAPATILDVGCGTGRLLRAAGARWPSAQLIGVDPAPGMVEVARRLSPSATFYIGPAESLPLPDGLADLALSTLSFHHWRDQAVGVREVARVLRPGGRFLLADFAPPGWIARMSGHARARTRAELRALFGQAGLTVVAQEPVFSRNVVVTVGTR